MTALCQNGWKVCAPSEIAYNTVPGTKIRLGFRKGQVAAVMMAFADEWNRKVENLAEYAKGDEWTYYVRPIAGNTFASGGGASNHAGYAADFNATQHPIATSPSSNFSKGQIAEAHKLLKRFPGTRWGGDYSGRKDGMHVEWIGSKARLALTYALVKSRAVAPKPKPIVNGDGKVTINGKDYPDIGYLFPSSVNDARKTGKVSRSVFRIQVWLRGLGYWPKSGGHALDGRWTPVLQAAFDAFRWDHRKALHITTQAGASGTVGYTSLTLLRHLDGTSNYPIKKET